ncbi:MAG: QueT transporter family protein [Oscillospiraceae bacterium]|nr:QueT transporter family protein [Oscillospiraceae bacterium]
MQKNEIFNTKNMVRLALVAAAYAVLTLVIAPLSYAAVQFRFSEALVLLCFYRKDYCASMILGCFIANLFSPFGLYDIIFGTLATAVAVIPMYYIKNIYVASLLPVISNGFIVGFELFLCGEPFWFSAGTVALGEAVVVCVLGVLLFKLVFEKSTHLMNLIGNTKPLVNSKKERKQELN